MPTGGGDPVKVAWAWTRMLGGVGILGLLLWRLGSGAFLDGLRLVSPGTLFVALGIGLVTTAFSAWRWCLVARGLGLRLSLRGAVADYYRALFLNATLPGGLLGDVDRAVRHGRDAGDLGRGVRAVVLERTAGQLILAVVGVAVLLLHPGPVLAVTDLIRAPHAATVVALMAVVAALVAGGAWLWRRGTRWGRALRAAVAEVRQGLFTRRTGPGVLLASTMVLAGHLATFVLAARVGGSAIPLARLLPLMVLALLVMAVPVNVGGWGPREGFCAWAFGAAGLGADQGLTVAVVYGVFAFVASLPGSGVLIARWAGRLRAVGLAPAIPGSHLK